jgi:hypothetical protein
MPFLRLSAPSRVITIYERGFPLGFKGSSDIPGTANGVAYLYNHLRLVFKYHMEASFEGSRIVGFEVEPFSVKHQYGTDLDPHTNLPTSLQTCTTRKEVTHDLTPQQVSKSDEVLFTYDVRWEYSDVKWASRWDVYLYATDEQIQRAGELGLVPLHSVLDLPPGGPSGGEPPAALVLLTATNPALDECKALGESVVGTPPRCRLGRLLDRPRFRGGGGGGTAGGRGSIPHRGTACATCSARRVAWVA